MKTLSQKYQQILSKSNKTGIINIFKKQDLANSLIFYLFNNNLRIKILVSCLAEPIYGLRSQRSNLT
jgi:hypothetical protein